MVRRVTPSQFRSIVRQAEQKRRQAINKYNQEVRRRNQKVKQTVNRYNQEVRTYNARVRANRSRLRRQLATLGQQTTTRHVVYRTSVQTLHEAYTRLESRAETDQLDPKYNRILDLSERETANSLEVTNRLLGVAPDAGGDNLRDAELADQLRKISPDLDDRWRGAVFALDPKNPDAARHFCTSAREIFSQVLDLRAADAEVLAVFPDCATTERGNPTRRSRIKYLLHLNSMADEALEEFVEEDMANIIELFQVLNEGTHGSAGTYDHTQLVAIKKRVEDAIVFLTEITAEV